jgi:zinc transporter 9
MMDQWLQEGNFRKTSLQEEERNWEEADAKLRREQAKQEKKVNEKRYANVVRAIKGNIVICIAKFVAWTSSGSSAMLSEFVHSLVDTLNQGLILIGLRDSEIASDKNHPYGYGKSLYLYSLISALGTFWMGAGISGRHSMEQLLHPSLTHISWEVWSVLALSLLIDGYVLTKTIGDVRVNQPKGVSFWGHVWSIRDPALMAILLEDGAACLGVVLASGGIILTAATGMPIFDGLAGVGVSALLAGMGLVLVRLNKEFLLGQAQDRRTIEGIQKILLEQESIEHVHSMQSQILGHGKFSFNAEVDFNGTYLAAKLMPRYQREFKIVGDNLDQELRVLLSWYAEDVMRTVEREVRRIEYEIRKVYPGAVFIELEPYSKDFYRYAVDDAIEGKLKRIEIEALNRYLKSLYMDSFEKISKTTKPPPDNVVPSSNNNNISIIEEHAVEPKP